MSRAAAREFGKPPATVELGHHPTLGEPPIRLWVPGVPAPQGSKSQSFTTGQMYEANPGTTQWRATVAQYAAVYRLRNRDLMLPFIGPVVARFVFGYVRPKSVPASERPHYCVKPDLDKLLRAAGDGITGNLLKDDCQIVRLFDPGKVYGDPGMLVEIWSLA